MSLRDKKEMTHDQKTEKVKLELEIGQKELELIIFPKEELQIIELT